MKLILLASTVIITLSLFVNFGIRVLKSNFDFYFKPFNSGYAIPGIVISVAIITFFFCNDILGLNIKGYFMDHSQD